MAQMAEPNLQLTEKVRKKIEHAVTLKTGKKDQGKNGEVTGDTVELRDGSELQFGPIKTKKLELRHPSNSKYGLITRVKFGSIDPNRDGGFSRVLSTYHKAADNKVEALDMLEFKFDSTGKFKEMVLTLDNTVPSGRHFSNIESNKSSSPALFRFDAILELPKLIRDRLVKIGTN